MFGLLKEEGYISCIYADNRVYNATLTLKGKCLTDICLNQDIIQTLLNMFNEHDLYVKFVHSNNYYGSAVSLNEMEAAWALKTKFCSVLLPEFEFSDMKGVVNSSKISIKMDVDRREVQNRLNHFYD